MVNFFQVEIFNNKAKYLIKSSTNIIIERLDIEDIIKKSVKHIEVQLFIRIDGQCNDNGEVLYNENPLNYFCIDIQSRNVINSKISSALDLEQALLEKTPLLKEKYESIEAKKYDYIIFEKDVFMNILLITQQYLFQTKVTLQKKINIEVQTLSGVEYLFSDGESNAIQDSILELSDAENIECITLERKKIIVAEMMNTCITSLNFYTGEYTLSLTVKDLLNRQGNIVLIRDILDFWNQLKLCIYNGDEFFCLKGEKND